MNNKIKIVYMINSLKRGGPVNMLYNLVKYIDKDKFEITIITMRKCEQIMKKDFSDIKCSVIEIEKSNILKTIKKVRNIINEIKPDIVHSHGGIADIVNAKVKGEHKTYSTVHCVPDEDFIMKKGKFIGKVKADMFIYNMKKIEYPIGCSETVSNKIYNMRNIKIDYVRNGIDININRNLINDVSRQSLGIDEDKIVFIFCGYLSKRKNVSFLVDVFEKIDRDDLILLILGDGSEYEDLSQRVKNNTNIIMTGRVENAYDYLKCGDYFISASLSEGLPLAVMEGMSYGLPPILSDIESHYEIKSLAPSAIHIFENNNVDNLINILCGINQENYNDTSKKSRGLITNTLNAYVMAKNYEKKYLSTL